jgi:hypothetical protein
LSSLTSLELCYCEIATIEAILAINGLSSLTSLDLGDSKIATIEANAFNEFPSLTSLDLATIEANAFNGLSSLTSLNLLGHQLVTIEANAFNGLSSLTALDLTGNCCVNIITIEANAFNGLSSLTTLILANNKIATIEANAFNGLSSLTSLDLTYNQFVTIEANVFNGLSSLTSLDLTGNQLVTIEANVFNGLSSLTSLDLTFNKIATIEANAFNGLSSLTTLILDENSPRVFIGAGFLDDFPRLRIYAKYTDDRDHRILRSIQILSPIPDSGVCPSGIYTVDKWYPSGSNCKNCGGRATEGSMANMIVVGVVGFSLLLIPTTYALGSYLQRLVDDDANSREFREVVERMENVYGIVPIFAQFLTITAIYTARIPWPPFLQTIFDAWQLVLGAIPGAPTECGGDQKGMLYGAEALGPLLITVLVIGASVQLGKCSTRFGDADAAKLRKKRLLFGFWAMLWNIQTYLFGRSLKPLRPSAEADQTELAFGVITFLVHLVTVSGFGGWLYCQGSTEGRRNSYLVPLVLAYKESHWWWFIATMLHLDLATATQVLVTSPVAGKIVQILLALVMHAVTYVLQPFTCPLLLTLMGASLLTQVAVCLSGLVLLLTESTGIRVLVDITLGLLLLAVVGRFMWELRGDIAAIKHSVARRCCSCCCCYRGKHSDSSNVESSSAPEPTNDGGNKAPAEADSTTTENPGFVKMGIINPMTGKDPKPQSTL